MTTPNVPLPAAPQATQPAGAPPKPKTSIAAWIGLGGFMLGLILLAVFFRDLFGSDAGGSCEILSDCKRGHTCISKKCYRECKTDADCQEGFGCGGTTISESPDGNAAKGFEIKSINICFSKDKLKK